MSELVRLPSEGLLQRTRDLATMSEDELRRFASEAARDRDGAALWSLTEAHLTLHGSSGSRVSGHTLSAYRHAIAELLKDWRTCCVRVGTPGCCGFGNWKGANRSRARTPP